MRSILRFAAIHLAGWLAFSAAGPAFAQDSILDVPGLAATDRFGFAVAGGADYDGDFVADLFAGAPEHDPSAGPGYVAVASGQTGSAIALFQGASAGEAFGFSIAVAGDIDADGAVDLLIGAPEPAVAGGEGRAVLLLSAGGAVVSHGVAAGDAFGASVAAGGDMNGDGFGDYAVGAPQAGFGPPSGRGYVRVISGFGAATLRVHHGAQFGDGFGSSAASGDIDGDGAADLLVGAPQLDTSRAGYVQAFSGPTGSLLKSFVGAAGDELGASVCATSMFGGVAQDVAAGAPGALSSAGEVRVFDSQNGALLLSSAGFAAGDRLGSAIAAADDTDGDGNADLIAGAPQVFSGAATGTGYALLVSNAQQGCRIDGANVGDRLGAAVASAGDIDGDGFSEVIVGAPQELPVGAGYLRVVRCACGEIESYGAGCPGSGGFTPSLEIDGCAAPSGALELRIQNALGGSVAVVFVSTQASSSSLGFGCTLLVQIPALILGPVPLAGGLPGEGSFVATSTLPPSPLQGALHVQVFSADPSVPLQFSTTGAVRIAFP